MSRPGVGFVQDRKLRLEHQHLQHFIALFFTARESLVHPAREEGLAHVHELHLLLHESQELVGVDLRLAGGLALGVERRLQQIDVVDARDLHRILESEEQAGARTLLRRQRQKIAVLEGHRAAGDLVVLAARQHLRESALARAVRAHDGVDFARFDLEVDSLEDLLAGHAGAQIGNFQHRIRHLGQPTAPSRLTLNKFCASTANSIGSSLNTTLQKPLTIMLTASSAEMPRCRQ